MKVQPKKALGQHFLTDPGYCRKIIRFAEVQPSDTVLEIGPGTGRLTELLLAAGARVIAVELDPSLVNHLRRRWPDACGGRLELVQGDVLRFDWEARTSGLPLKLVANLPYNIATRTLAKMTSRAQRFQSLTVTVQKEVAERILARAGEAEYGYFTVVMEYYFERRRGFDVPPGAFRPQPKVLSHVLQLVPRRRPEPEADERRLLALLKAAFRHRRKTLWNNLKNWGYSPDRLAKALKSSGIDPRSRPQELTLEQFTCLSRVL